jgi:hypothetical protein
MAKGNGRVVVLSGIVVMTTVITAAWLTWEGMGTQSLWWVPLGVGVASVGLVGLGMWRRSELLMVCAHLPHLVLLALVDTSLRPWVELIVPGMVWTLGVVLGTEAARLFGRMDDGGGASGPDPLVLRALLQQAWRVPLVVGVAVGATVLLAVSPTLLVGWIGGERLKHAIDPGAPFLVGLVILMIMVTVWGISWAFQKDPEEGEAVSEPDSKAIDDTMPVPGPDAALQRNGRGEGTV